MLNASGPIPIGPHDLGRIVREAWVRWALLQPNPKPSWLVPYDELCEADRDADDMIGEAVARAVMLAIAARNGSPLNDGKATYRIAPLRWECHRPAGHEDGEWWAAVTIFGMFSFQVMYEPTLREHLWRYCFDEVYDEGNRSCASIEEGKREAEAYYLERLLPALQVAQEPPRE